MAAAEDYKKVCGSPWQLAFKATKHLFVTVAGNVEGEARG